MIFYCLKSKDKITYAINATGTANHPKINAAMAVITAIIMNGINFFTLTFLNFNAIIGNVDTIK